MSIRISPRSALNRAASESLFARKRDEFDFSAGQILIYGNNVNRSTLVESNARRPSAVQRLSAS
jgi:hypothetical protein